MNNATSFGKGTQDISVNGNTPGQNNFQMDGVAIQSMASNGSANDGGIYVGIAIPNPDAIAGVQNSDLHLRCHLWTQPRRERERGHQVRHQFLARHGI